jgi:hypothetical protein
MKKKPAKSEKSSKSKSMMAMAAALGVSRTTLYTWRDAGAPIDKGEGAIVEWAMAENRRGSDNDEMRAAKLDVLRETARRLKIQNDVKTPEILKKDEVERDLGQILSTIYQILDLAFSNDLPQLLADLPIIEVAIRLRAQREKLTGVIRLEFQKMNGLQIKPADYSEVALHADAKMVFATLDGLAFKERVENDWREFKVWLEDVRQRRKENWERVLREASAAGVPVPNATPEEMAKFGLKPTPADYDPFNNPAHRHPRQNQAHKSPTP